MLKQVACPKMESWQVGDATITKLVEFSSLVPPKYLLPDAVAIFREDDGGVGGEYENYLENGKLILSVHMLVIDIGTYRIAVDTCVGDCKKRSVPSWSNRNSKFDEKMMKHGFDPTTFTHVVLTHIHDDHVGWNCKLSKSGSWEPTFPNAKYIVTTTEFNFWTKDYTAKENAGAYKAAMEDMELLRDSIDPINKKGLLHKVSMSEELVPGVTLIPSPGHTPGHVCVKIESRDERCFITGDAFHHPVQVSHPNISATPVDVCSSQASQTRKELLPIFAEASLVIGTHFAKPAGGVIKKYDGSGGGSGYRFVGIPAVKSLSKL